MFSFLLRKIISAVEFELTLSLFKFTADLGLSSGNNPYYSLGDYMKVVGTIIIHNNVVNESKHDRALDSGLAHKFMLVLL